MSSRTPNWDDSIDYLHHRLDAALRLCRRTHSITHVLGEPYTCVDMRVVDPHTLLQPPLSLLISHTLSPSPNQNRTKKTPFVHATLSLCVITFSKHGGCEEQQRIVYSLTADLSLSRLSFVHRTRFISIYFFPSSPHPLRTFFSSSNQKIRLCSDRPGTIPN